VHAGDVVNINAYRTGCNGLNGSNAADTGGTSLPGLRTAAMVADSRREFDVFSCGGIDHRHESAGNIVSAIKS
jgi:hypothetical protein